MNTEYYKNLNNALKTSTLRYTGHRKEQNPEIMQSANAFFMLVSDGYKNGMREPYHSRILAHIRCLITGGNEPSVDAVQIWAYPATVCAITLCKKSPYIWSELTDDEVNRLDFLMTAFAVMSNFISNDENNYKTGIGLKGDVWKERGANFKFPLIVPAFACAQYFGSADALDNILVGFDYDGFMSKAREYGFTNILEIWGTPAFEKNGIRYPGAKELLTTEGQAFIVSSTYFDNGNVYRGGEGKGAKIPYLYKGMRADDTGIITYLIADNHNGGECRSKIGDEGDGTFACYTVDGSVSEAEGKDGMLSEYNSSDPGGLRSDAFYCQMDFSMETVFIVMCKLLSLWSEVDNTELYQKLCSGNTDHIHKLDVGYFSQGMGAKRIEAGNNLRGHYFAKAMWEEFFSTAE